MALVMIIFGLGFCSGSLAASALVASSIKTRIRDTGEVTIGKDNFVLMRADLSPRSLARENLRYRRYISKSLGIPHGHNPLEGRAGKVTKVSVGGEEFEVVEKAGNDGQ